MPFPAVLGDAVLGSLTLGSDGLPDPTEPVFASAAGTVAVNASAGARQAIHAKGGEVE